MRTATAIVLVAATLIAGAIFLLRPSPAPETPRPRGPDSSAEPPRPEEQSPASAVRVPAPIPPPPVAPASGLGIAPPAPVVVEIPKGGVVHGTVRVGAPVSRNRRVRMDSDPRCAALHSGPPLSEEITVDSHLGLRWAFVYVKAGARASLPPRKAVALTQAGCVYRPRVLGVQVGQPVLFVNDDPLLHNVHALPFGSREFNFGQPMKGQEERRTFAAPEIMVRVKCDVHPWMTAWIGVLEHPYFAVTDAAGAYALPELPAGMYTVEVWHEAYRSGAELVEIRPGEGAVLNFQLDDRK